MCGSRSPIQAIVGAVQFAIVEGLCITGVHVWRGLRIGKNLQLLWGVKIMYPCITKLFRKVLEIHLFWADSWSVIVSYPYAGWLSVKYNRLLTHFPKEVVKARLFARLKIRLDKTLGKILKNYVAFAGRWKYAKFLSPQKCPANPDLQASKAATWKQ